MPTFACLAIQPIKGLRDTIVNPLILNLRIGVKPWKHNVLYSLIGEQAVCSPHRGHTSFANNLIGIKAGSTDQVSVT
jgi:hypothetical protein